jgi:hypothetical protein
LKSYQNPGFGELGQLWPAYPEPVRFGTFVENKLQEQQIEPAAKLRANLFHVPNVLKTKFLV